MSKFDSIIETMRAVDFREKKQFLEYLCRMAEKAKHQFQQADRDALLAFAHEEVEHMLKAISAAENYKEKDLIFECENFLLGLIMHLCGTPNQLPPEKLLKLKALTEIVNKERYIETTLDSIFEQPTVTQTDVNRLLYWVRQTTDEYQKSKLFLGLSHYQKDFGKLTEDARRTLSEYISSEMRRLMTLDSEDTWNALELLADVGKYFADENVTAALQELLQYGRNHINVYAVDTLVGMGQEVPQAVIQALAQDPEYAFLTHSTLQRFGKASMFPEEYATEEYLAKSDLVHWLTYPTELGQVPDAIEYIGKVKYLFKKEVFHVFKFRSNSDTLDEELKGKWLIGWSSNEGGTFSNFDEYARFEMQTTEATLKNIKKKLLG